jgi:hypothetical protein
MRRRRTEERNKNPQKKRGRRGRSWGTLRKRSK